MKLEDEVKRERESKLYINREEESKFIYKLHDN